MNEKRLKELTNGSFGGMLWKNCFSVELDGNSLIMSIPFKKVTLPLELIDKVTSQKAIKTPSVISYALGDVYLKIDHHYAKAPKVIYYRTGQSDLWIEAFKSKNIQIDITESSSSEFQKNEKLTATFIGISSLIVALAALIVAIIAIIKKLMGEI